MFHTFYLKYKSDREFKAGVALGFSLLMNIFYAFFKTVAAFYYNSQWFAVSAYYYGILSLEKLLIFYRLTRKNSNELKNYQTCYFCALSMLILNTVISIMCLLIIKDNLATKYPQYMIYLAALFTFYNFGNAVRNIIIYRRISNPLYIATKCLSMVNALVSVFFLQVAMLAEFGDGALWQKNINIMTGRGVYIISAMLAFYLFINARKSIKRIKNKTID